jgi:hypothetical protein
MTSHGSNVVVLAVLSSIVGSKAGLTFLGRITNIVIVLLLKESGYSAAVVDEIEVIVIMQVVTIIIFRVVFVEAGHLMTSSSPSYSNSDSKESNQHPCHEKRLSITKELWKGKMRYSDLRQQL